MIKLAVLAAGFAVMSVCSAQAQPAAPPTGHVPVITNPSWLKKPNLDEMLALYPSKANGRGGGATIACTVQTNGLLRACKVVKEKPEGLGFGAAALALAPSFLMKPRLIDGHPVEGQITIPINFEAMDAILSSGPTIRVVTTPPWDKTPTVSEILAELDKKVGDKFADGKVVFQCTVSKRTGHLSNCITMNVSAGMSGFTPAARALTSKFEVSKDVLAKIKEEVRVNLAFSFPDMASPEWSKRYLTHPQWIRTISPDPDKATFPEAAAKAGLKTGKATVDCVVGADGALAQCEVVSESTPNLGFGDMAIRIAETFAANPWGDDGLPVEGAHVRMPIQMDYAPPADAGPGPGRAPTPTTTPAASP